MGSWEERNRVSRICSWLVKVSFPVERATAVCGTAMFLASQEVAISLEAREIWSSDVFWGGVIWRVYLSEANMPSQGTLVFLCSCLHPYPCMLGSANAVDLLPEYMCLHTELECAPFEAETDSHDNHLTEVVDCVLMVDMSLLPEGEYSHTCDRHRVRIAFCIELSFFQAKSGEAVKRNARNSKLPEVYGVTNLRSRPLSMVLICACPRRISEQRDLSSCNSIGSSYRFPQTAVGRIIGSVSNIVNNFTMLLHVCDCVARHKLFPKSLARHANHI